MNILEVAHLPTDSGGSERSMWLGAEALVAAGHRVFLIGELPPPPTDALSGRLASPTLFDRRSITTPAGMRRARREADDWMAASAIDVVHVHSWPRTSVLTWWSRRLPVVVTVHWALCPNGARYLWNERQACDRELGIGCLTVGFTQKGCGHTGDGAAFGLPGFVRGMADDSHLRWTIARCPRVIAPSEWMRTRLIADGMPADRLRVVPPPITSPAEGASAARNGEPTVLYAGRMVEIKGVDHLVEASALVSTPHRLVFAGVGVTMDAVRHRATELGILDRCTFLGYVSPDELARLRQQCDLAVLPSLGPENFSMAGAEALAAGLPVVAYDTGGTREWCRDGVTGRLVPAGDVRQLADAIDELVRSPERRAELGANGRRLAEAWSPDRHAARLVEVYTEATAAWRPTGAPIGA